MNTYIRDWLLAGDPAIRWQTLRNLLDAEPETVKIERFKISTHGWGTKLLAVQNDTGMWGGGLYSPTLCYCCGDWDSNRYIRRPLKRVNFYWTKDFTVTAVLIISVS